MSNSTPIQPNLFFQKACIQIIIHLDGKPPIRFFSRDHFLREGDWRYQNKAYWAKYWQQKIAENFLDQIGNCKGLITFCEIFENLNGQLGKRLFYGNRSFTFQETQH